MQRNRTILAFCISLAVCSCGGGPVTHERISVEDPCTLIPAPPVPADTIRIALPGPVDPDHAPTARSVSERILFGHVYDPLFRFDCREYEMPKLIYAWRSTNGGRTWLFELWDYLTFHDGSPVTAGEVVGCWRRPDIDHLMRRCGVDSISAAGERTVSVFFSRPHEEIPAVLSAPQFMIARRVRLRRWPLGTGPYEIEPGPVWLNRPHRGVHTARPAYDPDAPVLVFLEPGARDPRDLLEGSVDVMITADRDVVEYAASRPHLVTAPLPWDRAYVLLSTTRVRELRWGRPPSGISRGLSSSLALDAVRGNARGHEGPSWWDELGGCEALSEGATWRPPLTHSAYSSAGMNRILFSGSDPVARDLAERILALAAAGPGSSSEAARMIAAIPGLAERGSRLSADGVSEAELLKSLREGDDFAYIVDLPLRPPDPCAEAAGLIERARWLTGIGASFADALLPLVDTRSHVIARRGVTGISIDAHGTVRVVGQSLSAPRASEGR